MEDDPLVSRNAVYPAENRHHVHIAEIRIILLCSNYDDIDELSRNAWVTLGHDKLDGICHRYIVGFSSLEEHITLIIVRVKYVSIIVGEPEHLHI